MKYDIFISYRRDGGEYTARILRDRLTELGYSVFLDVETLRSGAFNTKLYEAIDQCSDFLLVLSPNALDRCANDQDWVRREIEYALMKGKNMVPVLLRGFTFPDTLPKSLESLPYCNGVTASSEFFDAFIEKLQNFLQTRTPLKKRLKKFGKPVAAVLLSAVLLAGAAFGIRTLFSSRQDVYPKTQQQINLTEEVLANIGMNLTYLDNLAQTKMDALNAASDFLSTPDYRYEDLADIFSLNTSLIRRENVASAAVPEQLIRRLDESGAPFSSANLAALNTAVLQLQSESLDDLSYILSIVDPENPLSANNKKAIVTAYQQLLTAELEYHAICINQFLLPVTNEEALKLFWETTLTDLTHIPLQSATWSTDAEKLRNAEEKCYNVMQEISMDLATIVGNSSSQVGKSDIGEYSHEEIYQIATEGYRQGYYEEADALLTYIRDYKDSEKYLRLMRIRNAGSNPGMGNGLYQVSQGLTDSDREDIAAAAADFGFADTAEVLLCNSDVACYYLQGKWEGGSRCYLQFSMNENGSSLSAGSKLTTNYQPTFSIENGELRVDVENENTLVMKLKLTAPHRLEVLTYEKDNQTYTLERNAS